MKYYLIKQASFLTHERIGDGCRFIGLPGINCTACNQSWTGMRRLNLPCPDDVIVRILQSARKPVNVEKWGSLRRFLIERLPVYRQDNPVPGDQFPPHVYNIVPQIECDIYTDVGLAIYSNFKVASGIMRFKGVVLNNAFHRMGYYDNCILLGNPNSITAETYLMERKLLQPTNWLELGSCNIVNNVNCQDDENTRCSVCGYAKTIVNKAGVAIDRNELKDFEISSLNGGGKLIVSQEVKKYIESIKHENLKFTEVEVR